MHPDERVRVQVRRVAGELLDVQPRTAREERTYVGPLVNPGRPHAEAPRSNSRGNWACAGRSTSAGGPRPVSPSTRSVPGAAPRLATG